MVGIEPAVPLPRFKILTLLYVMAVFASGLASFGAGGGVAAVLVLCLWGIIFIQPPTDRGCWLAGLLIVFVVIAPLLVPAVNTRPPSRSTRCLNRLMQIGKSLFAYKDIHGHLPPAYTTNENSEVTIDEYVALFCDNSRNRSFGHADEDGHYYHALAADGSYVRLWRGMPEDKLRAALTIAGGERLSDADFRPIRRKRRSRTIAVWVFGLLTCLPAVKLVKPSRRSLRSCLDVVRQAFRLS